MKVKALTALAGAIAISGAANAAFTGLSWELWNTFDTGNSVLGDDVGLVDVWRVYATFDAPAEINAVGVASDGTPMQINNVLGDMSPGSGFWDIDTGPVPVADSNVLWGVDPMGLSNDTWLTLGLEAGYTEVIDPDTGEPYIFGGTPGFGALVNGNSITLSNRAIFSIPTSPYGETDENNMVLVGQFAVLEGEHVMGTFNLALVGGEEVVGAEFNTIPAPGALALLGLAGLAGTRRRRR